MPVLTKSILSTILLATGIIAVGCMLTMMGRAKKSMSVVTLRRLHKIFGFVFLVLLFVLSYFCLGYVRTAGDHLSVRAVFHGVFALGLIIVFLLKVAIVRFYKELMRFVPAMGLMVFAVAFIVYGTSAGFYFVASPRAHAEEGSPGGSTETAGAEDTEVGRVLFDSKCSFCHYADRTDAKMGPGLKGLSEKVRLASAQRPPTRENIRSQIIQPVGMMPPFKDSLTEEEIEQLLDYLSTL